MLKSASNNLWTVTSRFELTKAKLIKSVLKPIKISQEHNHCLVSDCQTTLIYNQPKPQSKLSLYVPVDWVCTELSSWQLLNGVFNWTANVMFLVYVVVISLLLRPSFHAFTYSLDILSHFYGL